jgi:hypothetical protein
MHSNTCSASTPSGAADGSTGRPGGRGLLRRRRRKALAALLILAVVFIAATAGVLVWPPQGAPASVDAIVLLAGPGDRMPVALQLAREHRAPVLVVSQGHGGYGGDCPAATPGVRTICFDPDPGDTRGEAEYVGRLARQYGWHSVLIVVIRPQAVRAQILMGRCFAGSTYLATAPLPLRSWPYQIVYGWGALFKALVLYRAC